MVLIKKFLLILFFTIVPYAQSGFAAETWAIYWYVCGSDLEQLYGAATNDIVEVAEANFSDNITVVMQTGGTKQWEELHDGDNTIKINPNKIERYIIGPQSLTKIEELPQANMGNPKTLVNFLRFCLKKYPADHKILIIWDHGGGSSKTFANDQNYAMEGMSLEQMHAALAEVFGKNPKTPPLDIIGFDACLMATIDTAMHTKD